MLLLPIFGQSAKNEGDVVLSSKTALCCLYSVVVGEQVGKCHLLWAGAHLSFRGRESMLVPSFRRLLISLGSKMCALRKNCDVTPCETTAVNIKEDGLKHNINLRFTSFIYYVCFKVFLISSFMAISFGSE